MSIHSESSEMLIEEEIEKQGVQQREEMEVTEASCKRNREESEDGDELWEVVKGKEKKARPEEVKIPRSTEKENSNNTEKESSENVIYMSSLYSKEPLPKQFAMARLLKSEDISGIVSIKYLNPYKIRIQFQEEKDIDNLMSNDEFRNRKWTFNRLPQVNYSYGVIKDVDMELSEAEIMRNIVCPAPAVLVAAKRLTRRSREEDGKWVPCETVRLCFRGRYLPTYVTVYDVKIIVDAFVFPVNQCFNCWKLGHIAKTCTLKKTICPKCSGEHDNCDTKVFKCTNCSGNHMAMMKICPAYLKEKRIREIMAHYNYTYVKAAQINASLPTIVPADLKHDPQAKLQVVTQKDIPHNSKQIIDYSEAVKNNVSTQNESDTRSEKSTILPTRTKPKKQNIKKTSGAWSDMIQEETERESQPRDTNDKETQHERKKTFRELLYKIKDIIFLRDLDLQTKIKSVIQLCIEWIMSIAAKYISDGSIVKLMSVLLNPNG